MNSVEDVPLHMLLPQLMHMYFACCYNKLDAIGVHPGQVPMLLYLRKCDGCSQRDLAEHLHVKAPTVTVMLNRMERAGLVERRQDVQDQRKSLIFITEKGNATASRIGLILDGIETELFEGISREEILFMKRLLRHVQENLRRTNGRKNLEIEPVREDGCTGHKLS